MDAFGDVFEAFQVACLDRLLQQLQPYSGIFQRMHGMHGLLRAPALVGIQTQQGAAFDGGIDGAYPLDIQADVLAYLDLQRGETAFDGGEGVRGYAQ